MRNDAALRGQAAAVLRGNWQHGHTIPSRTLYPHQWSWDAAFIAIGLGHLDPRRAWLDLEALFHAQWPDGRVPHIVFDPDVSERDYFPGPGFWERETSGLLWRGLRAHGRDALAERLRTSLLDLIDSSGCFEYFDPVTGAVIGTPEFSWTAALALDLLE